MNKEPGVNGIKSQAQGERLMQLRAAFADMSLIIYDILYHINIRVPGSRNPDSPETKNPRNSAGDLVSLMRLSCSDGSKSGPRGALPWRGTD